LKVINKYRGEEEVVGLCHLSSWLSFAIFAGDSSPKTTKKMKDENENIWEDSFYINWHETDLSGAASPESICNFLVETATRHADTLGYGFDDALELNQFWVVIRWYVRMYRYPHWKQELVMQTWRRKPESLFAYRDYKLKTTDGELLGAATSTWVVLDGVTRRPQRLELVEDLQHHTIDEYALGENAARVEVPDHSDKSVSQRVKFSDLDQNGHVTNARYMQWALDMYDEDFHRHHLLAAWQINFLQECTFGDQLKISRYIADPLRHIVAAKNQDSDKNIFAVELIWKKK
jgi:acyl-ACP thioesterase